MDAQSALTAAAVIAGGRARRLGGARKPLLVVGGRRLIERQLAVLRPRFAHLFLVLAAGSNDDEELIDAAGLPVVRDRRPAGAGPLAGVEAALAAAAAAGCARGVVCVAGDLPFLAAPVLELVRARGRDEDAVVPRRGHRPEPLLARYPLRAAALAAQRLDENQPRLSAFAEQLRPQWLEAHDLVAADPEQLSFFNVNTPEDLQRAEALASRRA